MSITPEILDEIRSRVSISELIGRRVAYDRHKSNPRRKDYWGCCPFHGEKTPSFHVDENKGFYHCFGCGAHGDIFKYVQEIENLSFVESVKRLSEEAGVKLPEPSREARERSEKRASLYDVMTAAQAFYREKLGRDVGGHARHYLEKRAVRREMWDQFGLGYAPGGGSELAKQLKIKGFEDEKIIDAGLAFKRERDGVLIDRFRDRLMFPILDDRERVVAFGGRAFDPEAQAKYLNSPETPLFHKGRMLYNWPKARIAAVERVRQGAEGAAPLIVAEGYMDVIALAQAGFPQAVAPLGTALTEEQILLCWKVAPEPVLCFDGDAAGLKAAYRSIDRALPLLRPGHSLSFAMLPEGADPDDLIKAEGAQAMRRCLEGAIPLFDLLWQREEELHSLASPEQKAALVSRLEGSVGDIKDAKVQSFYRRAVKDRVFAEFGGRGQVVGVKGAGRRGSGAPRVSSQLKRSHLAEASRRSAGRSTPGDAAFAVRENALMGLVLYFPELLEEHVEELGQMQLTQGPLDRLRAEILEIAALGATLDRETLKSHLQGRGMAQIVVDVMDRFRTGHKGLLSDEAGMEKADETWSHIVSLHGRSLTLRDEVKEAETAFQQDMNESNWQRLQLAKRALEKETEQDLERV